MKQARRALWILALCTFVLPLSAKAVVAHPAFASHLAQASSPTPTVTSDIRSLTPNRHCPQPPTKVDHATLSDAELAKYDLPRSRQLGRGKAAWQDLVRAMKHRVCGGTPTHHRSSFPSGHSAAHHFTPQAPSPTCNPYNFGGDIWTGNIAVNAATDSNCTQNNKYIEADAVFYVPCMDQYSIPGSESSWVGLGGYNNTNLVQAGTEIDTYLDPSSGYTYTYYYAWTENIDASNSYMVYLFPVNCNDRMQVYVYDYNGTYIIDHNTGDYSYNSYGPAAGTDTAEWIVERTSFCDSTCTPSPLASFQSETFYGMGTTVGSGYCSSCYVSPAEVDHDFTNMDGRTTIGPLAYDTAWGPPNYKNTITWIGS